MSPQRAPDAAASLAFWPRVPFLRMLLPLLLGIALAYGFAYRPIPGIGWGLALLGSVLLILAPRSLPAASTGQRLFAGIFVLFFTVLGYWRAVDGWPPNQAYHLSQQLLPEDTTTFVVAVEQVTTSERSIRLIGRIRAWSAADEVTGRLLIYLPPVPVAAQVGVGDHLRIRGAAVEIAGPANPLAFDAAGYYATQGVFHRLSARDTAQWTRLQTRESSLFVWAQSLRRRAERIMQQYLGGDELAVATALVLGKKDRLSLALRSTYADTGAMHVLAVSGLHVGIVGQFVFLLLGGPLGRRRWGRVLRLAGTLAAIWLFALLTGLAASVQRSALMFSLFYLGNGLFRYRSGGYNSLAFAAFLLLLYNPLQLFSVGFQLSFTAVAGILIFQRRLAGLWYSRWFAFRWGWELSCVGIAAQLGTLPLTLYYFHQFPLYFLLSGIPVVIGATVGLASGLGLLLLAGVPGLGTLLGWALEQTVGLQNAFLAGLQRLPGAVVEDIWVPLAQVPLWYAGIFALGALLAYRHVRYLRYLLWLILLLGIWRAVELRQARDQELLIVYDLYRESALDYVRGTDALSISSLPADAVALQYATDNWRAARRYRVDTTFALPQREEQSERSGLWRLGERVGWILDRRQADRRTFPDEQLDFLLVRENVWPYRLESATAMSILRVIVDGSNSPRTRAAWRDWGKERGVPVHCTATDGAFLWQGANVLNQK